MKELLSSYSLIGYLSFLPLFFITTVESRLTKVAIIFLESLLFFIYSAVLYSNRKVERKTRFDWLVATRWHVVIPMILQIIFSLIAASMLLNNGEAGLPVWIALPHWLLIGLVLFQYLVLASLYYSPNKTT